MNKDKINTLKKKYGNANIKAIESNAKVLIEGYREKRQEFIEILFYLEHTKRYKENKKYANTIFEVYLYDEFFIRYATYLKEKLAFFKYPTESNLYGVGAVIKAKKECGALNSVKVFKDLSKLKTPLTPRKIEAAIRHYAKPKSNKVQPLSRRTIELKLNEQIQENQALVKVIKEKNDQIEKLKASVEKYKTYKDNWEKIIVAIKPFDNIIRDDAVIRSKHL